MGRHGYCTVPRIVEWLNPKHFVIAYKDMEMLQSYDVIVAVKRPGHLVYLDSRYWDYSATTKKFLGKFLNASIVTVRKDLAQGKYILADLNSDTTFSLDTSVNRTSVWCDKEDVLCDRITME